MKPPPLDAPFEDKAVYLLKEIERLKKIPKYKEIMDAFDGIPEPKKPDEPKFITDLDEINENITKKCCDKYFKINRGY